jgi:hypothetical protein
MTDMNNAMLVGVLDKDGGESEGCGVGFVLRCYSVFGLRYAGFGSIESEILPPVTLAAVAVAAVSENQTRSRLFRFVSMMIPFDMRAIQWQESYPMVRMNLLIIELLSTPTSQTQAI